MAKMKKTRKEEVKRQGSKEARKNEHPTLNAEHRTSNKRKAFILVLETLLALKT